MSDKKNKKKLDGEKMIMLVTNELIKSRYGFVVIGLGVGAITMGTSGYIIAGVKGASILGGIGGAIGGFAGATELENKEITESQR
jgi:hypothetical protein